MYTAATRAGRNPDAVTLLAVTKYAPLEAVRELLASGEIKETAESRVQDAQRRKLALGALAGEVRWRMIGHLQTNKAKPAIETFDAIDSVDSLHCAQAIDKRLAEAGKTMPILIQVKLSERATQSGIAPDRLDETLAGLKAFPQLKLRGLMGIAPDIEPVEAVRPHFQALKALFDIHFAGRPGAQLSMGMSRDFEIAIEEGSTMVRIGSALFEMNQQQGGQQ